MTKEECIRRLNEVNCSLPFVLTTYDLLVQIAIEFNPFLDYEFRKFLRSDQALDYVREFKDFGMLCSCVRNVKHYVDLYYKDEFGYLENATPDQMNILRNHIIHVIENYPDPVVYVLEQCSSTKADNTEENWVEEDDDFLKKEVK